MEHEVTGQNPSLQNSITPQPHLPHSSTASITRISAPGSVSSSLRVSSVLSLKPARQQNLALWELLGTVTGQVEAEHFRIAAMALPQAAE